MPTLSPPARKTTKPFNRLHVALPPLLAIFALTACEADRIPFSIEFSASFHGVQVSCNSTPVALNDLRFYVSDVRTHSGEIVPLLRDDQWQSREVALIDLENGSDFCSNGNSARNPRLRGTLPANFDRGLAWIIGVPFAANHADPLLADVPLDRSAMHWHWRSGYKFLRAGVSTDTDGFWMHLGSSGCEGTIGNIQNCSQPNRVAVSFPDFQPGDSVVIELSALFGTSLQDDSGQRSCSSGPAETACDAPFEALGLAQRDVDQAVFKLQR